jgi:ankyrin repeat protein
MKARRIHLIMKLWLALNLMLVLLPGGVIAEDQETLNAQLMRAVERVNLPRVKTLLARGADVNAISKSTMPATPLMQACGQRLTEIVKVLLENGADVNAKTDDGRTALMAASSGPRAKIVKMLLDRGADVNAQAKSGQTPGARVAFAGPEAGNNTRHRDLRTIPELMTRKG